MAYSVGALTYFKKSIYIAQIKDFWVKKSFMITFVTNNQKHLWH